MKKVLALALALVMAFSMSAMAFAADTTTAAKKIACGYCDSEGFASSEVLEAHIAAYHPYVAPTTAAPAAPDFRNACPKCGRAFKDEALYNEHMQICTINDKGGVVDLTVQELLGALVELLKGSMSQWDSIESVVIRLVDFFEKITELGVSAVSEAEVKGAVADLENALADVKLPKVDELLNSLKQKVKDLYAGEVATTVVVEETTAAEDLDDNLGSSSVGIALFAAVSVAAAAAYVCTKKSK